MKKIKTVIRAVLSLAILSCLVFGAAGCKGGEMESIFYLSEAYETGLLSHDDLVAISEVYHNKRWDDTAEERMIEDFGIKRVNAIKKAEAVRLNEKPNAESYVVKYKEIDIIGYYGTYNQCVALRMGGGEFLYPDVVTTITIGGVNFIHTETFIRIWVKET